MITQKVGHITCSLGHSRRLRARESEGRPRGVQRDTGSTRPLRLRWVTAGVARSSPARPATSLARSTPRLEWIMGARNGPHRVAPRGIRRVPSSVRQAGGGPCVEGKRLQARPGTSRELVTFGSVEPPTWPPDGASDAEPTVGRRERRLARGRETLRVGLATPSMPTPRGGIGPRTHAAEGRRWSGVRARSRRRSASHSARACR